MGERLSGWVAARQTMTNSDTALNLYDRGVSLDSVLSTPLTGGDRVVGMLTAYAAGPKAFTDDQSRRVQMRAPHLDRIVRSRDTHRVPEAGTDGDPCARRRCVRIARPQCGLQQIAENAAYVLFRRMFPRRSRDNVTVQKT